MKKYIFITAIISFCILTSFLSAENLTSEPVYSRSGNKIVPLEKTKENLKEDVYLRQKLNAMDANLRRKQKVKALGEPVVAIVDTVEYTDQHLSSTNAHHVRYTDAEAIKSVQEAADLSLQGISQLNAEGGDIKYFEQSESDVNSAVIIYGKGIAEDAAEKFGELKVDEITGDFSITNSENEEIAIDASDDLKLNPTAGGNITLFRDNAGIENKHLFIYGKNENYSSLGYIDSTDDFQMANSKEGGDILLVTKSGKILAEGTFMTSGDIYLNCKGPEKDSYIYFYEDDKTDGAYIKYSDANKLFEFSSSHLDIAERVGISEQVESGDVIVFGENMDFMKSSNANSNNIIGVVSSTPAMIIGGEKDGMPIALSGQIDVKVCNQNGNIKVGDFLTSSDTPGYAMKSTKLATGSIIGQALQSLSEEKGVIKVVLKMR